MRQIESCPSCPAYSLHNSKRLFILAALLTIMTTGCCPHFPPVAHAPVNSDGHPCLILERGVRKTLYVNTVELDYLVPLETSGGFAVLADKAYSGDRSDIACLLSFTRKERLLENGTFENDLLSMADGISPPPKGYLEPEYIRWIVSDDPVVVAIGARKMNLQSRDLVGGVHWDGGRLYPTFCYRFVESDSLNEQVTDLFILTQWPNHVPIMGSDIHSDKEFVAFLAPWVRQIKLSDRKFDFRE